MTTMNIVRAYENQDRAMRRGLRPKPGFRSRIPAKNIEVQMRDDGHPVLMYLHPTKGRRTVVMPRAMAPAKPDLLTPGPVTLADGSTETI